MNKALKVTLWIGGIGAVVTAAFFIGKAILNKQLQKALDFCYGLSGYKVGAVSGTNISLTLEFTLGNKSNIDYTIHGYNFNVLFNGNLIGTVNNNTINQIVPAKKTSKISLNLNFNPALSVQYSSQNIGGILTASSSVVIGLKGTITASALGITINNYAVDISSNLADISKGGGASSKCLADGSGNLIV